MNFCVRYVCAAPYKCMHLILLDNQECQSRLERVCFTCEIADADADAGLI